MSDKNKKTEITNSQAINNPSKLTPWQKMHQKLMNAQSEKSSWQLNQEKDQLYYKKVLVHDDVNQKKVKKRKKKSYKSFQERLPKLKRQRNKKLIKQLLLIFSVFIFSILFMLYFISPFSKLEKIKVRGVVNLSKAEIIKASKLAKNKGILKQFFKKSTYERNIKKFSPRVSFAKIKISGINQFIIEVAEYREAAYEVDQKSQKYRPILSTGRLMNESIEKPKADLPKLKNFNKNKKEILSVMKQCSKLKDSLRSLITYITLTPTSFNPNLVILSMKDGNEVKISSENISSRLNFYPNIVKKMRKNGVINMEVGAYSYPFFKKKEAEKNKNLDGG
ncbi:MAG: FtsQ-type POTRA domain-containing protein [Streptococcaceae bacterium]|nr:FtsQ-type POTRA domain-containing protein [Streptococcaceae bacterium]